MILEKSGNLYHTELTGRHRLSEDTFELEFKRPPGFEYKPGQYIRLISNTIEREYSLVSVNQEPMLKLCIKDTGNISSMLVTSAIGTDFYFTGPYGYFYYFKSARPSVFIATGTGIAPFVSFVKSGVKDYILLHGVRSCSELYYESVLRSSAQLYIPCISGLNEKNEKPDIFKGRVTDYIKTKLHNEDYNFYLCGRREMIRDIMLFADKNFSGSLIYSEIFF